jgi:ClpP class serine protease
VPINEVASGKIFKGTAAMKMGLVDQIGYPADAWTFAASQATLSKPRVIRYEEQSGLMELLGAKSIVPAPGASGAPTINVNLNLDVHRLLTQSSAPMYLFSWGE